MELRNPQTSRATFLAQCPPEIGVGDCVCVDEAQPPLPAAYVATVRLCAIASLAAMPCVGVVTSKPSATSCVVLTVGVCSRIYSDLIANTTYVVGNSGRPQPYPAVEAASGKNDFYVQPIGVALSPDTMLISRYDITAKKTYP